MRKLREDTFSRNKNEDTHDHIDQIDTKLEDIHNFKQEGDKSLYQAWEKYNGMLYKCPTYDINNHQKLEKPRQDIKKLKGKCSCSPGWDAKFCKGLSLTWYCPSIEEVPKKLKNSDIENLDGKTPFNTNKGGKTILAETIMNTIEEASYETYKNKDDG
ncbi:hypothetical protein Tco_0360617 [Tanacetum coccineum]